METVETLVLYCEEIFAKMFRSVGVLTVLWAAAATALANCVFDSQDNLECSVR